jgi:predicted alpha-1,2-mannosidase
VLLLLALPIAAATDDDPARWVDPFIGTGGHGHTHPAATLPFGMVQLGPDTRLTGWDGCSGYHDTDRVVYGFSHTHLSGTGISDYGDILLMPGTGEPKLVNGYGDDPDTGYGSRFDKASERAGAGWYAVHLADYGIDVELTATERAGFHRYRFPEGRAGHVLVDLTHRDRVLESALRVVGDREIEGYRRSTGWAEDQVVWFVARFSRTFDSATLFHDDEPRPADDRAVAGENVKGLLRFPGGTLLVKVGISAVDVDGARRNLDAEIPGWDFDAVRQAARERWNAALGRIEVTGGSDQQRTTFYTALYHSLLAPNLFSDVDGRYRGMDRKIHRAKGRRHYTVFSLWDTFRATHPLLVLLEPERTREFVETFLAMYEQGGRLPVWELAGNETDTMIGYHAIPVIVDAWVKGIRGFDERLVLEAMIDSATREHFGLAAYRRQGFIGSGDDGESVSKTLEYAYDDWCIARMARGLGREDVEREFLRRAQGWRHVLDPETGFMRPRRNQRWLEPFDPRRVDGNYTEANAWQYSFFVPHDVQGLIEALGGDEAFVKRLDALFAAPSETTGRDQADITGLIGQYAHGNEPSHHMAWLYHYAGRPDKSADRVREILDTLYAAAPDGLSGNEDCGQMSSWYVLSALGLYPVCPCSDEYLLGGPLFDEVTLNLDWDRRFTIRAERETGGASRVVSATLDGRPHPRSFLRHAELIGGGDRRASGELAVELGVAADGRFGRDAEQRPRSDGGGEAVLPAPFLRGGPDVFRLETTVELVSAVEDAIVRYARVTAPLDSDEAELASTPVCSPAVSARDLPFEWREYRGPIELEESTRLCFQAERDGRRSPIVEAYLHRLPNDWTIELREPPAPQYADGGSGALIDGLRSGPEWRVGGWHGFQLREFTATVDLQRARRIRRAGAGFLQDVRSWIWLPREIVVEVSEDGREFREVARATHDVPDDTSEVVVRDLVADFDPVEARWVRITARGYGTIPDWHPGRGHPAWIFTDEVLISRGRGT